MALSIWNRPLSRGVRLIGAVAAMAAIVTTVGTARADWARTFGTFSPDRLSSVSPDGLGNVYAAGVGAIGNYGSDAILLKYSDTGVLQWSKLYGIRAHHYFSGVAADGLGNVYVSGGTQDASGTLTSSAHIAKFDSSGNQIWSRLLEISEVGTGASGIALSGTGALYISGSTNGDLAGTNAGFYDAYISKYDTDGTNLWTRQFGTSGHDFGNAVAVDALGSVFISGGSNGTSSGMAADAFLRKYDAAGTLLWDQTLATAAHETNTGVSVDSFGNIYISGTTNGSLGGPNAGGLDAFLSKYDTTGSLLWTKQIGTSGNDEGLDVSVDAMGYVFLSGSTQGTLGTANAGLEDAFVSKFDSAGTQLWPAQLGTNAQDYAAGVAADGAGGAYIVGQGRLGGDTPSGGLSDGFTARVSVPEPSSVAIALLAAPLAMAVRRRRA